MNTNTNTPAISVILTLYNRPQFMAEAIDSVLNQTLIDFEFLLIDDGSTNEKVAAIAREYESKDSRVRYIYKQNGGLADARNFGVEHSTAEIIAFCDDDDIQEPNRLQTQFDYLQSHPDVAAVTSEYTYIDPMGKVVKKYIDGLGKVIQQMSSKTEPVVGFCIGTNMIRRNAFLAVGGFRAWFRVNEDFDFGLRVAEKFTTMLLPERLFRYRMHDGKLSYHINAWRYDCATRYAAWCRQCGMPDPITPEATLDNVLTQAESGMAQSGGLRLDALRRARDLAKSYMRIGDYTVAQELLHEATSRFGSGQESERYVKKIYRDMMIWAVLYGKFGFFLKA